MKKILMRIVGALCILGAAALMFMPGWLKLEGVSKRELRAVREDVTGVVEELSETFNQWIITSNDFKDEMKDNDLPYTRGTVKTRFADIADLAQELLNDTVSMQELMTVALKAPGLVKDLENLLETDYAEQMFNTAAGYLLLEGNAPVPDATAEDIAYAANNLLTQAEDMLDLVSGLPVICYGLVGLLGLILALAVVSAVTHVCNKGRWLKYLYLVVLVALVAGSIVALPMATEVLAGALEATPALADMTLQLTLTPYLAAVLMLVPIVLDIIFERKKQTKNVEV